MAAGPSLTEKLSNIQHMPSLIAATIASEKPVDGYLIRDIIKMSYESLQTRVFLQKYLINLLDTSRNVYVKIKVLKLVLNLLDEGHTEFHRNLQKTPEPFKSASMLKATNPDVAGDCGRIRDLANKVLDRLFEDPPPDRVCPYGIAQQAGSSSSSNMNNGGSTTSYHGKDSSSSLLGGVGGGGGGRMQGFGNTTSSSTTTNSGSISSQLSSAVGSLFTTALGASGKDRSGLTYDKSYATMNSVPHYSSGLGGVGGGASSQYTSHKQHSPRLGGSGRSDWDDEEERKTTGGQKGGHLETMPITTPSPPMGRRDGEVGKQERRLVDEITAPGGVRAVPTREAMNSFLSRCKSLDCLAVVECLREKLSNDSNQTVLKALFVVEGLARSDVPDILSYLDLLLDELNQLSSSTNASIKAKSIKLLTQLEATTSIHDPPSTQETSNETLLMIGGEGGETGGPSPVSDASGLFAGLTLTSPSSSSSSPKVRTHSSPSPSTRTSKQQIPSRKQHTEGHGLIDVTVSQSVDAAAGTTGLEFLVSSSAPSSHPPPPPSHGDNLLDFGASDDTIFDPLTNSTGGSGTDEQLLEGILISGSGTGTGSLLGDQLLPDTTSSVMISSSTGISPQVSPLVSGVPMAMGMSPSTMTGLTGTPPQMTGIPMATGGPVAMGMPFWKNWSGDMVHLINPSSAQCKEVILELTDGHWNIRLERIQADNIQLLVKAFLQRDTVKWFSISYTPLTPEVIQLVNKHMLTLKRLSLLNDSIGDTEVILLIQSLKYNNTLACLSLYNNPRLTSVSATSLAELIDKNSTLTYLSVCCTSLTFDGILQMLKALTKNKTLTKLELDKHHEYACSSTSCFSLVKNTLAFYPD